MEQEKRKHIKELYTNTNSRNILDDICLSENLIEEFGHHLAEKQIPWDRIKSYVYGSFKGNSRIDPEELKLLELLLKFEGYMTPKNLDRFYELIKPFNSEKKVWLMMRGEGTAVKWYTDELQKAGFHTMTLEYDAARKGLTVKDQNEKGNPNMVIIAPYSFHPEELKPIMNGFLIADMQGKNKVPRIAIDVKEKDLPKDFNVNVVFHIGATMPAIIEGIHEVYRNFYLGRLQR